MTQRLPTVGADDNNWGTVLNGFLGVSHNADGTLTSSSVSTAGAEMATNKGAASGYAGLDGSSKVPIANLPTGTTSTTVAIGNDGRFAGSAAGTANAALAATDASVTNSRTPNGSAGGDLTGTYPSPTISGTANVESIIRANTLNQLATPTSNVNIGSNRLINVANAVSSTDGAAYGQLNDGVYGDGSDGSPTFDGTTTILGMVPTGNFYTLTRDLFLASPTINNSVNILTNGFRLFVNGTFTGVGTAAIGPASIFYAGGSLGQTTGGQGYAGGTIAAAQTGSGSSASGLAGSGTSALTNSLGGRGGNGGSGTNAAGTSSTVTAPVAASGTVRSLPWAAMGAVLSFTTGFTAVTGGTGGASGGGGGSGTVLGGSGGAGGGVLVAAIRHISGSLLLNTSGGPGGNASGAGNAGGGGGGGGGVLILISQDISVPTCQANGAAGGTGVGTGTAGATGAAGTIIKIQA